MDRMVVTQSRCKQCGRGMAHCPQEAIAFSDTFTEAGYRPAQVDDEKCVKCGFCYILCPDRVFEIIGDPRSKSASRIEVVNG